MSVWQDCGVLFGERTAQKRRRKRKPKPKLAAALASPKAEPLIPSRPDLERAFLAFHKEHPEVYRLFVKFTTQAISRGRRNLSAGLIAERIRWETTIEGKDEDGFKLNNNFRAAYVRMFEREHPEHRGFFRKRASAFDAARAA